MDTKETRELALEIAFAFRDAMTAANKAIEEAAEYIGPLRPTKLRARDFTIQKLREVERVDVMLDRDSFEEVLRMVMDFNEGFMSFADSEEARRKGVDMDSLVGGTPREIRDICGDLNISVQSHFRTEADIVEHLLNSEGYHKWLSYTRRSGLRIGEDIERKKDVIEGHLRKRLSELKSESNKQVTA